MAPAREPDPAAPAEPSVLTSIAELLASGDAWASELADVPALRTSRVAPVAPPSPPTLAVLPPVPVAAPRIQLGFRDGTSATLDPESEQGLALELLAQSLTRRD